MSTSVRPLPVALSVPAALLDTSGIGIVHFDPVYAADAPADLIDLAYVRLNPAAQRLLRLPEFPAETLRVLAPQETAFFAFCRDAFQVSADGTYVLACPDEQGQSQVVRVVAQRMGLQLVASFTPITGGEPAPVPPPAWSAGQALWSELQQVFEQAPVAISIAYGPRLVVEVANAEMLSLWDRAPAEVLGKPLFEALPEVQDQGLEALFEEVLQTGTPWVGLERPAALRRNGQLETRCFNFVYHPLRDGNGQVAGVITVATEATPLVQARHQLRALDGALQATHEALDTNTAALAQAQEAAQHADWQLDQEREAFYQVFAQTPAAICFLRGPEYYYEYFNAAYQELFPGYQLLGRRVAEVMPEAVTQGFVGLLDHVYATGETYHGTELPLVVAPAAGQPPHTFYFNFTYQAYQKNGHTAGITVFAYDVTEQVLTRQQVQRQQRAEARQAQVLAAAQLLARERETLYQVFAQTPAMIAQLRGPEHRFEYVNAAYQELFPGRTLVGRPIVEALPETVPQGFVALLDDVYRTGRTYAGTETPLAISQPDGQPPVQKFITFTYQAYQEHDQAVGVSVFACEVTEQVLARQQREAGLSQLRLVFEHAPVALALLQGPTYEVEMANPAICDFWGRNRAQVLGRPLFEVLPEVVGQGYPELLDAVRRTGRPFIAEEKPVELHRQGRSETVYFNFVYQPLFNAQGQVKAVVIVAIDVSPQVLARQHLALANEELRAANTQLLRTNVDLDNFIYTASHDLKAPIANIESLLIMLRKQLPAEARQQGLVPRVLGMMQGAIERFQLTIAQLTDLAQLQQAHAQPLEQVDPQTVVEAVRLDLAPQFEAADAHLTVEIEACATVLFAPQYLRSVVYNLLSNALKYRHPDRRPEIQLHCHRGAGHTVLAVQDNGLGLTPAQQDKLFGLFRRLHAHVEGSGVGLYMVKRMVENAGGTIGVQSQAGVGSTFTVSFPDQAPSHA